MKQQKEFYAIAQNGTNKFLAGYKNRENALTFSVDFTSEIRCALIFEKGNKKIREICTQHCRSSRWSSC